MRQRTSCAPALSRAAAPAGSAGCILRRIAEHPAVSLVLGAPLLLWPALYNGYPLVFADTGTYLSQAIEHYLGWDRPVFYSFFLLPLHLTLTTWPAIAAQALLTAYVLHLLQRALLRGTAALWLVPLLAAASIATALPWFVSQLMPDMFTPLLVLSLAILTFAPARLVRWERYGLIGLAAFAIAAQHSSLALAFLLCPVLLLLRARIAGCAAASRSDWVRLAMPSLLAAAALLSVNLVGQKRLAITPFGNVFLLARVIYDGPGRDALRHACPQAGWRLCPWRDQLPARLDDFLWRPDSPVMLIGGHKVLSTEADAIIATALRREPVAEALAFLGNLRRQLGAFATGDGLHAWPDTVGRWVLRDFPRSEHTAFAVSRQNRNRLAVPGWMQPLHAAIALAGVTGCLALLVRGVYRPHPAAGFAAAVLLALLLNAAIAGGLSTPHDRYQSRVMLLPPLVAAIGGAALLRDRLLQDRQRRESAGVRR